MFTILFLESYNRTRFDVLTDVRMVSRPADVRFIDVEEGEDLFGGDDIDHEVGNLFLIPTTEVSEYRAIVDGLREMGTRVKAAAMVDVDLTGADRDEVEGVLYDR